MRRRTVLFACFAAMAAPLAAADMDIDALCLDCHRGGGGGRYQAPVIEGQHAAYLAAQLARFRERHRDSFPMSPVVAGLDDAQLDALARVLSVRDWPAVAGEPPAARIRRGAALPLADGCEKCHGEGMAGAAEAPRLAGQQRGYLERQLRAMAAGTRTHPEPSPGGADLSTRDIRDLAAWLQAGAPPAGR
ncbi:c-type cytochrome [Pseudofulvimonas gallinarii]|uniref:Cytochrome c553 n=1 Tax=Pseudofulvimonas gallinarii TaxID=634155 RepID=A0A4V2UVU9_9GAMM|nr:c-type cytochrome [Pseudofulvimonas gallinarii]TCS97167.1 cytochrome c553 [Pseudofulvimonas gallinarii]